MCTVPSNVLLRVKGFDGDFCHEYLHIQHTQSDDMLLIFLFLEVVLMSALCCSVSTYDMSWLRVNYQNAATLE